MGKTYRKFKGESHREKTQKKWKDSKWFGFTDGNHTDGEQPIKGKDFIKYGYPNGGYPKHMVIAKKKGYDTNDDE